MGGRIVSRLSLRALFSATACVAFTAALGSIPSKAEDQDASQAEWPQSYEVSPRMAVQREATPILSSATVDATQAAIEKYQDVVTKGGWESVPAGPEQRVGSRGGAVEALRTPGAFAAGGAPLISGPLLIWAKTPPEVS